MLDKVLHALGGAVFAIPTKHMISAAFIAGVGVELFGIVTHTGRFDPWDVFATTLGGMMVFLWNKGAEVKQ